MSDRRLDEELSAYLDGESPHPEQTARLLQKDAEAARRYMKLAKLSAHLKALKPPSADPAFVTRVLARVGELGKVARPGRMRFALPATVGVAVLLLVGGVLLYVQSSQWQPSPLDPYSEDDIMAEIAERLSQDPYAVADEVAGNMAGTDLAAATADEWIDMLASEEWFVSFSDAYDAAQDVDVLLGSLNEEEVAVFKDLLLEYAAGEWKT